MKFQPVLTSNILKLVSALKTVRTRDDNEEGMIFLFGRPGEGKTTAIGYILNLSGGARVRALKIWTPLTMLQAIGHELDLPPSGRRQVLFEAIRKRLKETERTLFVDEVDYLFENPELLDILRDLYDATRMPVVFCGEKEKAMRVQTHERYSRFRRRFLQWVEFRGLTPEDMRTLANEMIEHTHLGEDLLAYVLRQSEGNIDRVVKAFGIIERWARRNHHKEVTLEKWADKELFEDTPDTSMRKVS